MRLYLKKSSFFFSYEGNMLNVYCDDENEFQVQKTIQIRCSEVLMKF